MCDENLLIVHILNLLVAVHMILRIFAGVAAMVLITMGLFLSSLGALYVHTYFTLYLPNKAFIEKCSESCSIDGFSNLDVVGAMAITFIVLAIVCFVPSFFLTRFARRRALQV
jgi:hypothetical protein